MKTAHTLLLSALTLSMAPAMAHTGPEAMDLHFIEHLLIALVIGLPLGYGLLRVLKKGSNPGR